MFGCALCMRLDFIWSAGSQTPEREETHSSKFIEDTQLWVRSFCQGPQWVAGIVIHPAGNVMCKIKTPWDKWTQLCYRHEYGTNKFLYTGCISFYCFSDKMHGGITNCWSYTYPRILNTFYIGKYTRHIDQFSYKLSCTIAINGHIGFLNSTG